MPAPYSSEILSHIDAEIVPHIITGTRDSLAAYEQGFDPDEDRNFFDNYMLGCSVWNNIYNRIYYHRMSFLNFKVTAYTKVLKIFPVDNPTPFYISRVGEDIRIPKTGLTIKRLAQEQLFLSDELQNFAREMGVLYLGYDLDGIRGLGDITLELLTHVQGRTFQPETLHTFRSASGSAFAARPEPENIIPPRPMRKQPAELAKLNKKDKNNAALIAVGGDGQK